MTVFAGVVGVMLACGACGGPRVSGIGLFRHNVMVGQEVRVSLPFDAATGEGWRLAGFDSAMLEATGRETIHEGEDSRFVFRFRARTPGTTKIEFEKVRRDGSTRRSSARVRIHEGMTSEVEGTTGVPGPGR